jgi:hypothetical protein
MLRKVKRGGSAKTCFFAGKGATQTGRMTKTFPCTHGKVLRQLKYNQQYFLIFQLFAALTAVYALRVSVK